MWPVLVHPVRVLSSVNLPSSPPIDPPSNPNPHPSETKARATKPPNRRESNRARNRTVLPPKTRRERKFQRLPLESSTLNRHNLLPCSSERIQNLVLLLRFDARYFGDLRRLLLVRALSRRVVRLSRLSCIGNRKRTNQIPADNVRESSVYCFYFSSSVLEAAAYFVLISPLYISKYS